MQSMIFLQTLKQLLLVEEKKPSEEVASLFESTKNWADVTEANPTNTEYNVISLYTK